MSIPVPHHRLLYGKWRGPKNREVVRRKSELATDSALCHPRGAALDPCVAVGVPGDLKVDRCVVAAETKRRASPASVAAVGVLDHRVECEAAVSRRGVVALLANGVQQHVN